MHSSDAAVVPHLIARRVAPKATLKKLNGIGCTACAKGTSAPAGVGSSCVPCPVGEANQLPYCAGQYCEVRGFCVHCARIMTRHVCLPVFARTLTLRAILSI